MSLLFSQLVSPLNQASWVQYLLTSLQGIGPIIQSPGPNTNQLMGTGTISVQGPANEALSVVIRIAPSNVTPSGNGNADTATPAFFQYSIDGGQTYQPVTQISVGSLSPTFSYAIPGTSLNITFENGSYTTAGSGGYYFVVGETYAFVTFTPTFPVTNWPAIGVGNSLVQTDAQALSDLNLLVAQAIAGGFTQSWINPPLVNGVPTPPPDGWLDLLAQSFYDIDRTEALQTQGVAILTALSTSGPFTILPGQLIGSSNNGLYSFTNITGGVLAKGGVLQLTWQATEPGSAYNQVTSIDVGASGFWLTSLLTPLAGVSLTNPLVSNPAVTFTGIGSGTVTISAGGGGPANAYSGIIKIITSGAVGSPTTTFSYSLNGGNTYSTPQEILASVALGASNMTASFSGTFNEGDIYAFSTNWITQYGTDEQSSLSLATECQDKWATLSPASPTGQYLIWALAASPEVVNALVVPDSLIPGQVDITLIGANNGPVSSNAIVAVTNYIEARIGLCLTVSVQTVEQVTINTAASYIIAYSAYRNTIQSSMQQLFNIYADSILPLGSVELSEVAALIQQTPGVKEINPLSSLTLNGFSQDIQLAQNQTAMLLAPLLSSFQFI
jgi:uncharacterized phage protein gp47/JayE